MQNLNDRELATILAALRYWQRYIAACGELPVGAAGIATDGGTLEPLEPEEIDALCERLNTTG